MNNYREIDEQRDELSALIMQAERRLTMQIDPYVSSRRGVDFGEYFYDLKRELIGRIFSEQALSNSEISRGLNQNVDDSIRACYEGILKEVLYHVGVETFHETKQYVIGSHSDMVQQVQALMQNVRNIISTKDAAQITDGNQLLQEADRLIGETDRMLAVHKSQLEALKIQLSVFAKERNEEEARKQQEEKEQEEADPMLAGVDKLLASTDKIIAEQKENLAALESQLEAQEDAGKEKEREGQAKVGSMLESVDKLIASTDEMIAAQKVNLAALENQLRGYITAHSIPEETKAPEVGTAATDKPDAFRLSDEDMKNFNNGVKKVMNLMNGGIRDMQQEGKDSTAGSTLQKPTSGENLVK